MNKKRWLAIGAALGLIMGGFLLVGAQTPEGLLMPLQPLLETYEIIQTRYIEKVDPSKLVEGAVKGMVESLGDPYSSWIDSAEHERREMIQQGRLGGLGVRIATRDAFPTILHVLEGTPAEKAGLKAGDQISVVDGRSTRETSLEEVANRLRGKVGTRVKLTIQREEKSLEFTLTRAIIREFTIKKEKLDEEVGYLHIVDFQSGNTAKNVKEALHEFRQEKIVALILDLRDNGGGLLTQAVEVTDEFLNSGKIVSVEGRDPTGFQVYHAQAGEALPDIPLAVLINEGSASASEIVAGAIKDHGRGLLVGTDSFGKGTVQETFPLPNGGAVTMTIARYYLPSGETIKETGIVPDITVEAFQPTEKQNEALAGLQESNTIESFLGDHPHWERENLRPLTQKLNQEGIDADEELVRRVLREKDRDEENDFLNDLQLLRAWEVLKAR
ncbi:S41 family peptidase [Candidatus Aerophobetes bacterium]|uniref:S41 family peptidase n=1 Tax=Aerophobetes bacterium TaxID=2030807 RepID=A0A523WAT4_UNCAE|nr:MAG: S41 family peptidase [Candidatus Aerophobetes bacterium]